LAQRVESTGTGGDRSINSPFTCYVNNSFFVKEWEKEKEKKRNLKVIGEEGDESDVKIKEKWFGKQNRKEDETYGNENENKGEQRRWWK